MKRQNSSEQPPAAEMSSPTIAASGESFFRRVKNLFPDQPEKFKKFLGIFQRLSKQLDDHWMGLPEGPNDMTKAEFLQQVMEYIGDQADLVRDFNRFMTSSSAFIPAEEIVQLLRNHLIRHGAIAGDDEELEPGSGD